MNKIGIIFRKLRNVHCDTRKRMEIIHQYPQMLITLLKDIIPKKKTNRNTEWFNLNFGIPRLFCHIQARGKFKGFSRFIQFRNNVAWISSDYFESLLQPQLLRGENKSKQSEEIQARDNGHWIQNIFVFKKSFSKGGVFSVAFVRYHVTDHFWLYKHRYSLTRFFLTVFLPLKPKKN